jgi:hypothetical protein
MTQPATTDATTPLPRCCPSHPDLATLTEHLVHYYRQLPTPAIVDTVWRAHTATDIVGLSTTDRLETVELITRYQLEVVCRCQQESANAG